MSKQVEDNKELQEDMKNREAELKREMEEKRQVGFNLAGNASCNAFAALGVYQTMCCYVCARMSAFWTLESGQMCSGMRVPRQCQQPIA